MAAKQSLLRNVLMGIKEKEQNSTNQNNTVIQINCWVNMTFYVSTVQLDLRVNPLKIFLFCTTTRQTVLNCNKTIENS